MRYGKLVLRVMLCVMVLSSVVAGHAQETFEEFRWYEGDMALRYPAGWQNPLSAVVDNYPTLHLQADDDTRIVLSVRPPLATDTDLYAVLAEAMRTLDILPTGPLPARLLDVEGVGAVGVHAGGLLYGVGRIVSTDEQTIILVGRGSREERAEFTGLFDNLANSLLVGADSVIAPLHYGVLWSIESYPFDGDEGFIDGEGLFAREGRLYLVDTFAGVFVLDAETGLLIERIAFGEGMSGHGVVVGMDGTIYVGDMLCGCIQRYANNQWRSALTGFDLDAPLSMTMDSEGRVLATDMDGSRFVVRVFENNQLTDTYRFNATLNEQPLLVADADGRVFAVSDNGEVFGLVGDAFGLLYTLDTGNTVYRAVALTPKGHLAVATERQGILLFDETGAIINRIGRIVVAFPMAGELVAPNGISFSADGRLFWVDSDGSFGRVTGVSPDVEPGRVGLSTLTLGDVREGSLNATQAHQTWTMDAQAGDNTQVRVITDIAEDLDLQLRVIAPDGTEVILSLDEDDEDLLVSSSNVVVATSFRFAQTGIYSFIVEHLAGEGVYWLGLTRRERLPFDSEDTQRVTMRGRIDEARVLDEWVFRGQAGRRVTITLESQDFWLDPLLRLYDADGNLLEENDMAEDASLGQDAQIARFILPRSGDYVIEATRFEGTGAYLLTLEIDEDE